VQVGRAGPAAAVLGATGRYGWLNCPARCGPGTQGQAQVSGAGLTDAV